MTSFAKHLRLFLFLPVLSLSASTLLLAVEATPPSPNMPAEVAMMPGLKIGDNAPEFTLPDAAGAEVSLKSFLKEGKVALVFYRSGDWCPYCIAQLKELQANLGTIEKSGVHLVAISYDSPETLTRVAAKYSLTFPLLSDVGSKTIDAYGIRNQAAKGKAVGVPHPVIFILDQSGKIGAKLMNEGYKVRPAVDEIIAAASGVR